jgi:hypothetical protein
MDARATSRFFSSTTSHSTNPTSFPARTTLAFARSVAFHTGRRKLIFSSRAVKLSSAASSIVREAHGSVSDLAQYASS